MNQKDLKIIKLYNKGVKKPSRIAEKIGYAGNLDEGVKRVREAFKKAGIQEI